MGEGNVEDLIPENIDPNFFLDDVLGNLKYIFNKKHGEIYKTL